MFHGWRTVILNVVSVAGTAITTNYFGLHLDPTIVALIVAGLNVAKRYLAPTHA